MKITATVVYPVSIEIEIDKTASDEQKREALLNEADNQFHTSSISALIQDCSEEQLEE